MVTPFHSHKPVMKYASDDAFSAEKYEFKQLSEEEMAMIMGGGDGPDADFMSRITPPEEDALDR